GPAAWAAAAMNPQTALRGAMQRGEPIMFRITIDRLREDRRQTNHAKSQLALAFCQAHAFALALVAECCAVGDCDESMIMCAQWALETLGKRAGADGDADGEGVGEARESLRGEALRSFLCCCADGQLKLALRVGTLFRLDLQAEMTAEERGGMARRLAEACAANAAAAGAVALLRRWPCLQLGEAVPGVLLPRLVAQGLSSLAISWAEELDGDVQTLVLHACIARNHLRSARALREAGTALRALCDPALVKAGCGLADDVAKLAWACPALRNMRSCLDLARLRTFMGPLANKRGMLGLSSAAEAMLGKPLDKGLRMSAWQRRPLTPAQLRYAALDALVSVQIVDAIVRQNPKLGSRRGLHAYVFDAARV
ncbi:hypothetical protein APUTEX25_004849, partial [Auxenochlorella protothecoides]